MMLNSSILISLAQNVALLLSLTYLYGLVLHNPRLARFNRSHLLEGLTFGLFGVLAVMTAIEVYPGFFLDARAIVVVVTGAFSGPVAALLASGMIALYRMMLGGGGVLSGVVAVMGAAALGTAVYYYRQRYGNRNERAVFLIVGGIAAINALVWPWAIGGSVGRQFAYKAALPMLVLVPAGIYFLRLLLSYRLRQLQMEQALRDSEERYRTVIAAMSEGFIYRSVEDGTVSCNASAETILGLSAAQIQHWIDENWRGLREDGTEFAAPDRPAAVALRTGQPQLNVTMGIQHPEKGLIWLLVNSSPLFRAGSSQPYAVMSTFTDITERRQAQTELLRERDTLRTLIDNIPDYIFIKDAQGRFVVSNAAHNQIAGVQRMDELVGKTAFDVFPPHLAPQFNEDDQMVLQGQALVNIERTSIDLQGKPCFVLTTKVPLRDAAGQVVGLVGISRNITHRKKLEEQTLQLAAERQRAAVLHRFITDISHDFRTPLSILSTSTELLRKHTDPDKREKHLRRIEEQITRVTTLLDAVVEMADLERNVVVRHDDPINLQPLLTETIKDCEPLAKNKGVKLLWQQTSMPIMVNADAHHIRRAVHNLLENAIQYNAAGGWVMISTQNLATHLVIEIRDSGIGMTEAEQQHIFEHFYRADEARSMDTGGTGLGLPIARKIVEAHGGTISVESQPGQGSTFTVTLPLSDERVAEAV
ncbi:MAG: PAS domain S-box protein [Chloroflexi bacterium]|nr:PAS domain S-box protein [Chloroflexota bacterium]